MVQINNINTQKFSLNGVEYFKNFTPIVVGNKITIVNTYDSKIVIVPLTSYQDFEIDTVTYGSVSLLQTALLPVIFTRSSLGVVGDFLSDDATTYTAATLPLTGTEVAILNDGTNWKKITWNNIKAQLKTYFDTLYAPIGGGGGDEFFYIHMNQYVQYSQAPTTWFGRAYGPQNVGWHATANQHTLSIGTNPLSFDAQSPAVTLPFDCQVEEAFVTIQRSNGDNRTLNLRFYAFDIVSSASANIKQVLNISTLSIWGIKSLTTDFTVPANTFTKGQRITTVTNQSSDLTGVAVSWEVLIKLKKI